MYFRLAVGILVAIAVLMIEAALKGPPPVSATYRQVDSFGVGEITIANHGKQPVTDWRLAFSLPGEIKRMWGGTVVSQKGGRYTVQPEARTQGIPAGASVVVGFQKEVPGQAVTRLALRPSYGPAEPIPTPTPSPTPMVADLPADRDTRAPGAAERPNYAAALQMSLYFYEAQRSGVLTANKRVAWRGDSALQDGADVGEDLVGGYYDAGDHIKFTFPLCASLTVLAWGAIEYPAGYERSGQWKQLQDTLRWGTDWLMKAHVAPNELYAQVGEGEADHAYWGPPERMTMARKAFKISPTAPGSDLAGEAAAALAATSLVFRKDDPAYADLLLERAKELFSFAVQYQGKYSDSVPAAKPFYVSTDYWDELVWAATWLYRATGQESYLAKAEVLYEQQLRGKFRDSAMSWDDKKPGLAVLLARLTKKPGYQQDAEAMLDLWTVGHKGRRVTYTAGGLAWLTKWGTLRYSATAAFLAFVYTDRVNTQKEGYRAFAMQQIDYILGENPAGQSFMVGYGPKSPRNPHHRAAHGSMTGSIDDPVENAHVLYGALVGGPTRPDDHAYIDDRTDEHGNEVALDYNAGLSGALARMVRAYGGEALEGFPPPEPTPTPADTSSPGVAP